MNAPRTLLTAMLLSASAVSAQSGVTQLCHDATGQDRQPDFSAATGKFNSVSVVTDPGTTKPALRLNTNLEVLNPERIYFPFTQQVRVSYLYESAGNSASLGYFYYKDLIDRGYIDIRGTPADSTDDRLIDSDGNGIADFHEDLYGMSKSRAYMGGASRRCTRDFEFPAGSGKRVYEPELAMNGSCDATFRNTTLADASAPPYSYGGSRGNIAVSTVGSGGGRGGFSSAEYGDKGMYGTIPNLLEPRDNSNNLAGIGHLVFLHSDDDGDTSTTGNLTPVADVSNLSNGIPDYNVSAYDADGRPVSSPDNILNQEIDRTVNLGEIPGDREIVFFIVSWGGPGHSVGSAVYPCLSFAADGKTCKLHIITPTIVFFSKTFLNMDQNAYTPGNVAGVPTVATRDIGCAYTEANTPCVAGGAPGWLDAATLVRLNTVAAYNNLVMPVGEKANVKADTSGRGLMPHVLVGAPSTDKYRWVLGFEDLPGGGDRDFNDVSFMIHKSNGGVVRSAVVSSDLSPSIAQDFTITEVTFRAIDEPYFASTSSTLAECKDYALTAEDRPRITYQVALDCKICTENCGTGNPTMVENPSPTWVNVAMADPLGGRVNSGKRDETVTINDFLQRSLTGSQLCWQAVMQSKHDKCQPTIRDINVSYKAVRAGDYTRAALASVANVVLYSAFETPGRKWFESSELYPSTRVVDGRSDLADRGHVYLKELFKPETPAVATMSTLWDGGAKLGLDLRNSADPTALRKLYTLDTSNNRTEVKNVLLDNNGGELFSTVTAGNCSILNGGFYLCDLNNSGGLPDNADRALLRNWLYGWENKPATGTATKRTWSMGGIQLSTPVIVGPYWQPGWFPNANGDEQRAYLDNFQKQSRVTGRPAMVYVGTTQGMLHGLNAGLLKSGNDVCTGGVSTGGYYDITGTCTSGSRKYGDSAEQFAYMPRKLLPYYVNSYLRQGNAKRPQVDASAHVMDVDLGSTEYHAVRGLARDTTQKWSLGPVGNPSQGAKSVLVASTGPMSSVVFALDVTDPRQATYPLPMWEFDMAEDKVTLNRAGGGTATVDLEDAFADYGGIFVPDTRGSRHVTPIMRMDFGKDGGNKWVAAVATDFVPNANTAGAIYLVDIKTGKPAQINTAGNAGKVAGVIPLEKNAGVAAPPVALDYNQDGTSDLLYTVTTTGSIYRITTSKVGDPTKLGRALQVCRLGNVREKLDAVPAYRADAPYQGVYSRMAVKLESGVPNKVRLYVGTSNNPDISNEPADLVSPRPSGYVVAFEDTNPFADNCTTLANVMWIQQLGVGQQVWGGVTMVGDKLFTTTAVGKAASACELSGTESGRYYNFAASTGVPQSDSGSVLGGHSVSRPVVGGGKLIFGTIDSAIKTTSITPPGTPKVPGPARIQVWETNPQGILVEE